MAICYILQLMESLKLYFRPVLVKAQQYKLFCFFQILINLLLLEALMDCYAYIKSQIRNKPKIFMLEAKEN